MGEASEARKFSFFPTPKTRGLPSRAPTIKSGSSEHTAAIPYVPTTSLRAD